MIHPITDPELRASLLAIGFDPDEDFSDVEAPEDISATPRDEWENCTRVTPPPAIARYLASDDTLTNHTIDMMELALEKNYHVAAPWCITSMRSGSEENRDLAVDYFYLLKE